MCIQATSSLTQQREVFLRDHLLFSLLICETYNLLTSKKGVDLSAQEIYSGLSPFLKDRINYVYKNVSQTSSLFSSCEDIVAFVASILVTKLDNVQAKTTLYSLQAT